MDSKSILHPGQLPVLSEDQGASSAAPSTPEGDTPIGYKHRLLESLFGKPAIVKVKSYFDRGLDLDRDLIQRPFQPSFLHDTWDGDTCLHLATSTNRSDVVWLLLERGADPNARNASLCTPLHNAIYNSCGIEGELLNEYYDGTHGTPRKSRNSKAMMTLKSQCISFFSWHDVVTALLESGADINLVNSAGVSALQDAIQKDDDTKLNIIPPLMIRHAVRLQEANLKLSEENIKIILEFKQIRDMRPYRNSCRGELERMNQVRLDARTTLRDVLSIHDPRGLQRLAVNEELGHIVAGLAPIGKMDRNYTNYGYLVRLQYRRGVRIAEAVPALLKLYADMMAIGDNALPQECAEMVVYYLSYEELGRVIQAALL